MEMMREQEKLKVKERQSERETEREREKMSDLTKGKYLKKSGYTTGNTAKVFELKCKVVMRNFYLTPTKQSL
jgi:hypothetical protein